MSKTISAKTKDLLKEAVHDVTILTDEGMHPTSALIKVAKDLNLTADHTRLVGRAFNTAHTATTREQGKNILDKLASTPIADCEGAVEQLSRTKEASVSDIADVYFTDRSLSELRGLSGKIAQDLSLQEYVKTASKEDTWQPGHRHRHYCEKYGCDGSDCDCDYCRQLRADRSKTAEQLLSDLAYLEGAIKKCAGAAEINKDGLEGTMVALQKYASRCTPSECLAIKLAAQDYGREAFEIASAVFRVPGDVRAMKTAAVHSDIRGLLSDVRAYTEQIGQKVAELRRIVACRDRVALLLQKKTAEVKPGWNTSPSSLVSGLAKMTMLDRLTDNPEPSDQIDLQSRFVRHGIGTPDHKRRLDSIRMQSAVNDMLSNDEIISQHDPEEVYRVYNELIESAPSAMERPGIARSFVREALAKGGLLGPFDFNPLMSYDKDIASHRVHALQASELAGAPNASSDRKANIVKNLPRV